MTQEFNKDKWTCPNDRHLQLRAKYVFLNNFIFNQLNIENVFLFA